MPPTKSVINKPLFKIWSIISLEKKIKIGFLYVLILFASLAEVVSIGSVVPFIGVLTNPDIIYQNEYFSKIITIYKITNQIDLIKYITIVFVSATIFAAGIRILLLIFQTKLSHLIGLDIGSIIFEKALHQPYQFHLSNNSGNLVGTISNKVSQIVMGVILPSIIMLGSITLVLGIVSFLIFINPILTIITIIGFSIAYALIIFASRKKLESNSIIINKNTNNIVRIIQEAIGGIRDIIIDGTQRTYVNLFKKNDFELRKSLSNNQVIGQSPRYLIEAIAMILIATFAYYISQEQNDGLNKSLPMLATLAIGGQRILPMIQQIFAAWSAIKGATALIDDIITLHELPLTNFSAKKDRIKFNFNNNIELHGISFSYPNSKDNAVKNVNLKIKKGSWIGIIGKSGSGKSTLLDIIMGLLSPSEGELKVDGQPINLHTTRIWQNKIAHIPQNIFISDTSVEENIAFGQNKNDIDQTRLLKAAQIANLMEVVEKLPNRFKTILGERGARLSGGQRQRIGIARALYKNATLLILDEATSALDTETESQIMKGLQTLSRDITVIIVAHRVSTLNKCDFVIKLNNGNITDTSSYDKLV